MTNNVTNKWEELKALVESLEEDVKNTAGELVKLTLGKE